MTDLTAQKLAAAAAELYLITLHKPRNSPMRLLGPADLRLMRLPGFFTPTPLALPEHSTCNPA